MGSLGKIIQTQRELADNNNKWRQAHWNWLALRAPKPSMFQLLRHIATEVLGVGAILYAKQIVVGGMFFDIDYLAIAAIVGFLLYLRAACPWHIRNLRITNDASRLVMEGRPNASSVPVYGARRLKSQLGSGAMSQTYLDEMKRLKIIEDALERKIREAADLIGLPKAWRSEQKASILLAAFQKSAASTLQEAFSVVENDNLRSELKSMAAQSQRQLQDLSEQRSYLLRELEVARANAWRPHS